MKHQEELQAVAAVVCVFALALLTLLFILKWDDVLYFLQKRVRNYVLFVFLNRCAMLTRLLSAFYSVVVASNEMVPRVSLAIVI